MGRRLRSRKSTLGLVSTGANGVYKPVEIGNYLPLEVKLNIVLEVAFNSSQPGMRHAGGLLLHFPTIKAVRRDKNVDSVDNPFCTLLVSPSATCKFINQF
jgi:hypothetical protein